MLGTRTKQVSTYGRRGQRIVNASDDRPRAPPVVHATSSVVSEETSPIFVPPPKKRRPNPRVVLSPSLSPRPHPVQKKSPAFQKVMRPIVLSRQEDTDKPVSTNTAKKPKTIHTGTQPMRHPLGILPSNLTSSPAPTKKGKGAFHKSLPLKPSSHVVQVDIVNFDQSGRRVSQERRVSRSGVQVNPVKQTLKKTLASNATTRKVIVLTDSEEEVSPVARPQTKAKILSKPIVIISSDESDSELDDAPSVPISPIIPRQAIRTPSFPRRKVIVSPQTSPESQPTPKAKASTSSTQTLQRHPTSSSSSRVPAAVPVAVIPSLTLHVAPSRSKPRQLTPIRNRQRRSAAFPAPPSPPSPTTPSDFDLSLSLDFDGLSLSPPVWRELQLSEKPPAPFLVPLLQECSQTTPHEFSAFIDMFPFDSITRSIHDDDGANTVGLAHFQKIGEASYSEVFGIGDVVLKVIPLRDEDAPPVKDPEDFPAPSDAKDVLKEIIVTRAMGETCKGFVQLLRTYIVRGKYPSLLLDLWDEYHERKGSESIRPDSFSVSQVYAIIVLPNGGPDLEAYSFASSPQTRWRRACSIFWQVTRALAEAEDLVWFEHRDLHWGQILVKAVPVSAQARRANSKTASMDDVSHGVKTTIIDLGLSRMNAEDGAESHTIWTPFEPEIFEGEGDYQFDVYRMMKVCNGGRWESYHSLTNVMWLHYLVLKLLHGKRLRAPVAPRKTASTAIFSEKDCYDCLVQVEDTLAGAVAGCTPQPIAKKGRRKIQAVVNIFSTIGPQSATEVLELGVDNGWMS